MNSHCRVLMSASEGGTNGGGLPVSTGFGLVACSPLAASHEPNFSSFVMSDGVIFCIGTTLTSETASCHIRRPTGKPGASSVWFQNSRSRPSFSNGSSSDSILFTGYFF